jgi:SAM-dependent methyltransferase
MSDTQLLEHPVQGHKSQKVLRTHDGDPACPLTGSQHIQVLEEFPTSLLVDGYQRDLGINVATEFQGIERLQLCRSLDSHVIFFHPTVTGSSKFYERLRTFNWYFPGAKFEYQRAAAWITTGDRVLDIGCGAAQFASYIPDASYHGLDPHVASEVRSTHRGTHIRSEKVTSHAKTGSQTYDVVCAFQVLEHIGDPRTFLRAALECLKPCGLLILGVPSAESYITRIPNFVLNAPPHHITWWTDGALRHLAEQFHLAILEIAHAPVEPWETRLYWMQKLVGLLSPDTCSHFTESKSLRGVNIAAYIGAALLQHLPKPPSTANGATVVMIARKQGRSS